MLEVPSFQGALVTSPCATCSLDESSFPLSFILFLPPILPQTVVDIHSSEWAHSLEFLFAQGPGELGKVEESSMLSSLPTLGSLLLVPAER